MYTIRGKVRHGRDRGKKLGFPTANINLHKQVPQGIYVSETTVKGTAYPSVSFIGNAKTFEESKIQLETHIFSFNQDIYGETISVRLIKKIRDNEKFDSVKNLVAQIKKDVKIALIYFKNVQRDY